MPCNMAHNSRDYIDTETYERWSMVIYEMIKAWESVSHSSDLVRNIEALHNKVQRGKRAIKYKPSEGNGVYKD
jgi:hypothetical protein